jgi:hypothetical protein
MAIEVVEAPAVHEAVILRILRVRAAGRDRPLHEVVDLGAAAAREREETLGVRRRVADLLVREVLEAVAHEEHHERLLADDHAGRGLVRELRVEGEAERREEADRPVEVPNGQVDEDLSGLGRCHVRLLLGFCT